MEKLTARECEVMQLVCQGKSNEEICVRLNIAISTMKTHLHTIYDKYGIAAEKRGETSVLRLRAALKFLNLL